MIRGFFCFKYGILSIGSFFMKKLFTLVFLLFSFNLFSLLASGENNLHGSGEINQKKSKEKSHYQF